MHWINLAKIITKQEIRDGLRKKKERESALKNTWNTPWRGWHEED